MANNKDKRTVYQNLNRFFNLDGFGFAPIQHNQDNNKVVIKGNSPEDIKRKGLEIEQRKKIQDKYFRTTDRGFQKALQYEAARLPAYIDYEGMEYYPIISSALDLFMEEATTIGSNGKMLNIYSNKDRIKYLLEEFFYDILNVNVNLPFWTRNVAKYGDNFVLLYGERKKGITHVKQMVNYEVERFERIQKGKPVVKFKERMTGDEFNVFEVAHFRLLGDDKYLPYGSSVLNKVRRVFRQLVMGEDAMLTYRIIRAGEKKVFKIDVGNIDEEDIEDYIYKVATKFKKSMEVSPNDGQIDYRFNILGNDEDYFIPVRNANVETGIDTLPGACLSLDTKINLLDGRSLSLNNIINEYESGKQLWSYSINPQSGNIVPGKITWAGVTRKNAQVLKLTLDNGETITCTPDHKFPTKYNGIKEAKDLLIGESMWSFNKKFKKIKGQGNDYEMIYDHSINDWVYTHRIVNDYINDKPINNLIRHHKDFNRYNNNPENIERLTIKEYLKKHNEQALVGGLAFKEKYNTNEKFRKKINNVLNAARTKYHNKLKIDDNFRNNVIKKQSKSINNSVKSRDIAIETFNDNPNRESILNERGKSISKTKSLKENRIKQSKITKQQWKNSNLREIVIEKQSIKYSNKLLDLLISYIDEYNRIDLILENKINIENSEWLNEFNRINENNKQLKKMSLITRNNIDKMLKYFGYSNWRDFKSKIPYYNHKIVSIEWLEEKQDTGTITIDGQENLHNFHNFALNSGIFTNNSNLDQIQDIEYLRDNLFTGLGIPKPFLSFQDAAGGGKNMAQYDIRFAKKINRIQQSMIQELNKMAMIHLYLLGYDKEDIGNFTLTLTNPSTQQEMLKAELFREKSQVYTELTRGENGIAAMSHTKAKRIVFNMSDREIVNDLKQQKMEKVVQQELADAPVVIKQSGIYSDIDKKYGEPELAGAATGSTGNEEGEGGGIPPEGGAAEGGETPEGGEGEVPFQSPTDLPPIEAEGVNSKKIMSNDEYNKHIENIVYGDNKEYQKNKNEKKLIKENIGKNDGLNKKANEMVNEIDSMLEESEKLNENDSVNIDNIDLEKLDDINLKIDIEDTE